MAGKWIVIWISCIIINATYKYKYICYSSFNTKYIVKRGWQLKSCLHCRHFEHVINHGMVIWKTETACLSGCLSCRGASELVASVERPRLNESEREISPICEAITSSRTGLFANRLMEFRLQKDSFWNMFLRATLTGFKSPLWTAFQWCFILFLYQSICKSKKLLFELKNAVLKIWSYKQLLTPQHLDKR